jgi:hypothetical protein
MYGGFWKNIISVHHTWISRSASPICFFYDGILADTLPTKGRARRLRNVLRRGVRTDRQRDEGVGAGGGHLGSSVGAWRSLAFASPARVLSLPLGQGLMLRRTVVGRSRKSGTVWQRRSLGSPAAGKPGTSSYRCLSSCSFFRLPRWRLKLARPTPLLIRLMIPLTPALSRAR